MSNCRERNGGGFFFFNFPDIFYLQHHSDGIGHTIVMGVIGTRNVLFTNNNNIMIIRKYHLQHGSGRLIVVGRCLYGTSSPDRVITAADNVDGRRRDSRAMIMILKGKQTKIDMARRFAISLLRRQRRRLS